MKCRCGYEASVKKFLQPPVIPNPPWNTLKCPRCGAEHGFHAMHPESIEMEIYQPTYCYGSEGVKHYPVKREAYVLKPNKKGLGAAGVHCPLCRFGHGGGCTVEDCDKLNALLLISK